MTAESAIVALLIAGGGLQIAGVLLVVAELRAARALAAKVISELAPAGPAVEVDDAEDTAALKLKNALIDEVGTATRRVVRDEVHGVDAALREAIYEQLTGGLRVRRWGVFLIVLGVVTSTIAGIWSTVAAS